MKQARREGFPLEVELQTPRVPPTLTVLSRQPHPAPTFCLQSHVTYTSTLPPGLFQPGHSCPKQDSPTGHLGLGTVHPPFGDLV